MSITKASFAAALLLGCTACGATMRPLTIPEQPLEARAPEQAPEAETVVPRFVAYPGLEVSYVSNAEGEVYHYRGVFYTYFDGNWFYAQRLRGPWKFVEMKYVPSDLFRVRGHHPHAG